MTVAIAEEAVCKEVSRVSACIQDWIRVRETLTRETGDHVRLGTELTLEPTSDELSIGRVRDIPDPVEHVSACEDEDEDETDRGPE